MAKDYAKAFYKSKAWEKCRNGYMQSRHYVCERCGGVATICHHKVYITPENINDPSVTLNWSLCEALCQTCHNMEHHKSSITRAGLAFDNNGNLIQK
ncbi:HNH endonuclease [Salicibibacter kimchii]|uniref:HNH endonuclease n=1 Tax=Salicibibacter kimchii TaxID=2099786 RepID=A0A345C2I8_9BACI|nr:HNH endonuclease [Salicibibacter kimchii]AXF57419.1 HNH endonuclease [Salicibibacter kimchii]